MCREFLCTHKKLQLESYVVQMVQICVLFVHIYIRKLVLALHTRTGTTCVELPYSACHLKQALQGSFSIKILSPLKFVRVQIGVIMLQGGRIDCMSFAKRLNLF